MCKTYEVKILDQIIEFDFDANWFVNDIDSIITTAKILDYAVHSKYIPRDEILVPSHNTRIRSNPFIRFSIKNDEKEVNIVINLSYENKFEELVVSLMGEKTKTGKNKKDKTYRCLFKEEDIKNAIKKIIKHI